MSTEKKTYARAAADRVAEAYESDVLTGNAPAGRPRKFITGHNSRRSGRFARRDGSNG